MKIRISPAYIGQSIQRAQRTLDELQMIAKQVETIAEAPSGNREELILRKYIELQRSDAVAAWLDCNRMRSGEADSGRKYLHTDVTDLITSKEQDGAMSLRPLARAIYSYNKGKTGWTALVKAFRNGG